MKQFYKKNSLAIQVLIGVILGIVFGAVEPKAAAQFKPLGDAFINMVKMIIPPIIFVMIAAGIAGLGDVKKVGKMGGKTILYFEIVTTIAIFFGLVAVNVLHPGSGLDISALKHSDISTYTAQAKAAAGHSFKDFLFNIVPPNAVDAFAKGDLLQVLFFSVLFGFGLASMGERGKPITSFLNKVSEVLFEIINIIMKFAPIGVFGAISYTIGKFGIKALIPLSKLVGAIYLTSFLFIIIVFWGIAKFYKIKFWKLMRYIKDEIIVVLATASSETVLPKMMSKMERYGCSKGVVGLVLPTGYSFNLDGTSIYMAMAVVFIAQMFGVHLGIGQQLTIIGILMVTSKGAAAVTGAGFVTLAATVTSTNIVPVEGLALILGVDRFLSMNRACINLIGNALATVVIAKSEKEFDEKKASEVHQAMIDGVEINYQVETA